MGSSFGSVDFSFPSQNVLLREWKSNISQWVKNIHSDVIIGATQRAMETLSFDRVGELLNESDSPQKVFDVFGVAMILEMLGDLDRSMDLQVHLTEIVSYAAIDVNIAGICSRTGRMFERVRFIENALEKEPENVAIWNLMGSALMSVNEKERGLEFLRKSIEKQPENEMFFSDYLLLSHRSDEFDCSRMFEEHKRWAKFNAPNELAMSGHQNDPNPNRKLRIGYVLSKSRTHHASQIIKPIIDYHNKDAVEVFIYGYTGRIDFLKDKMKKSSDCYRGIDNVDDKKVAQMIIEDKIDILVDICGHSGGNRLGVFAYKPAPIQVSYMGYFDTSGMDQIDYFLTDNQISPPETQRYHTEQLFPLDHTCFCYQIPEKTPGVVDCPAIKNGHITFGMLDSPAKITPKMAGLWAQIMRNTKDSRLKLVLKGVRSDELTSVFLKLLVDAGISRDRLDICEGLPAEECLSEFGKVDIVLDTYPYNGGVATCDALWMGVPVISLVGEHHFSRVGLSLLDSMGLGYFACKTEDEYVAKACVFASKVDALATMRNTMRQRMQASAVSDMPGHTRSIENAFREMWRRWCNRRLGIS